jgi:hypothetical protein
VSAAQAHVTLAFELDSEPISGSLRRGDSRPTLFSGWIELVSLLQAAATTPAVDQGAVLTVAPWPEDHS